MKFTKAFLQSLDIVPIMVVANLHLDLAIEEPLRKLRSHEESLSHRGVTEEGVTEESLWVNAQQRSQ